MARSTGIYLDGDHHTISNNVITGGGGIALGARGVIIENNTISTSGTGIAVTKENNVIIRNTISSGGYAIELAGNGNMILNNTLTGSRGVNVKTGYGNTIAFNLIYETGTVGVYFSKYTGDNLVYGNTFWYCYNYEAADESGKNQWYLENETHKLGNYWSYNKAPDNNGDGITDEPYHIGTTTGLEIIDKYPLAQPLVSPYQTPPTTTSTQPPQTTPPQTTTQVETESSKTQTTTPITTPSSGVYTSSTTQETSGLINTWYIVASAIGVVFILGHSIHTTTSTGKTIVSRLNKIFKQVRGVQNTTHQHSLIMINSPKSPETSPYLRILNNTQTNNKTCMYKDAEEDYESKQEEQVYIPKDIASGHH